MPSNHRSGHAHLAVIGSKSHAHSVRSECKQNYNRTVHLLSTHNNKSTTTPI